MDDTNLPPIPEGVGPQVCSAVRLHLAVLDNLPPERVQAVYKHLHTCASCTAELRLLKRVTQLVADFASRSESEPSARVDQAVMMAIAARNRERIPEPVLATTRPRPLEKRRNPVWGTSYLSPGEGSLPEGQVMTQRAFLRLIGQLAVAALFLLAAVLTAVYFHASQPFAIPAGVSWSGYVLYHSETRVGASGMHYRVESYHDLDTHRIHVETIVAGRLDVVAVGDGYTVLGMDMMHHVAQMGADAWSVDDSLFDLAALRSDMQANRAIYLGKNQFHSQDVYCIRSKKGSILLLNMRYMPVNVLYSDTDGPMYDTLTMYPAEQIASSMWDMSMPAGFQVGTLPAKP